jgi:hypothetical protein
MKTAVAESSARGPQRAQSQRAGVNTRRPKTGERSRVRQPLRLDRPPLALPDRIRAERVNGRTWDEIERDKVQCWHDLRVEQGRREREGRAALKLPVSAQGCTPAHPIPRSPAISRENPPGANRFVFPLWEL